MKRPFVLILGENGCGKSLYAEALVRRIPLPRRVYVATMQPYGEEGERRVQRHRAQRAGDGYETREIPRRVGRLRPGADAAALLEDVSNLVANIVFDPAEPGGADEAVAEVEALRAGCGALVAVSVCMPPADRFTGETAAYIDAVGRVNAALAARADAVVALSGGEASVIRGELPW